jgi:5-methylthioribose kinase
MGALVSDPQTKHPNYPSLDTATPESVGRYLCSRNFVVPGEQILRIEPLSSAARNLLVRVVTSSRSFVIKQFRSWPSSDGRPTPTAEHRFRAESQFYRTARIADCAKAVLPEVLHQDAQAGCLILEDVGAVRPLAGREISAAIASQVSWFLVSLHHHSRSVPTCAHYRNEAVLGWQMTRLFAGSAEAGTGGWLARWRARSDAVRFALEDGLSAMERGGASLVHGDFSPENWVQNGHGPRVVDGEFSFFGPPEYDAGAMLAGLMLERSAPGTVHAAIEVFARGCFRYDLRLVAAFAGVHLCHRLESSGRAGASVVHRPAASALLHRLQRAMEDRTLDGIPTR